MNKNIIAFLLSLATLLTTLTAGAQTPCPVDGRWTVRVRGQEVSVRTRNCGLPRAAQAAAPVAQPPTGPLLSRPYPPRYATTPPVVPQPLPPPPPPAVQPLPTPPPNPGELYVASAGTMFPEQFDVDGTWSGQVLVNGVTVLRRAVSIRGTERPRIRVDPAPATMVGGLPGQIRVQVVCQTIGYPAHWAPVRWIWPNTLYRVTPSYCDGW